MPGDDRKRAAPTPTKARVRRGTQARIARPRSLRAMSDDDSNARRTGSSTRNASGDRARSRAVSRKKVAAMKVRKYRVVFERDESGAWIARIPSVRGCHTYGRTLDQARRRIREALSLWVDDAGRAEFQEQIKLPAHVRAAVNRSRSARKRADRERERAQAETAETARTLVEELDLGLRA